MFWSPVPFYSLSVHTTCYPDEQNSSTCKNLSKVDHFDYLKKKKRGSMAKELKLRMPIRRSQSDEGEILVEKQQVISQ